ncbi:hypothetical protein EYC80_010312 [Monilinia laxa]|uniref:Uncharacterized protein n=1 Tax=Monilinia laxa TaxID=61186 RepID=A0A5N6JNC7_MONLA|nr:hypothetical protein EYC80_010312 [Monilinia laxa]
MSLPSGLGPGKSGKMMAVSFSERNLTPPEQQSQTPIPSPRQLPALVPDTPLAKVTCEEIENLEDRLFRLTSDHQRLYGVFMPNGEVSSNTTIWKLSDINLPFLFGIRQQLANLQAAAKIFESGEKLKDDQAFFESQRTLYSSLVEVVASAIERLTWLRRELEGPNGYAYQYSSWFYQVIGNNPRSTDTSSANRDGKGEREDPQSYEAHSHAWGDGGPLVSPVTDSDDDREERPEKRQKI